MMCFADFIRDDPATGCPEPRTKNDWQAFMKRNGRVGASRHRQVYISQCGWYILTSDVVEMLAAFIGKRKTIEVGAGTGYLASQLALHHVNDYRAVDIQDTTDNGSVNYGVEIADATTIDLSPYSVVVMCWPPYDEPFGTTILNHMVKGQILIFQGESEGGCTGDEALWSTLDQSFTPIHDDLVTRLNDYHVEWFGIHDHWNIFIKT